jgi:hypothetical protein
VDTATGAAIGLYRKSRLKRMERVLKATVAQWAVRRRADYPPIEALYRDGSASG